VRLTGVAVCVAIGACVSRVLLRAAPSGFASDLAQPIPVATNWGVYGLLLWCVLALALCAAGTLVLRAWTDREPPSLRAILVASALALACGALWIPLFSSDVYAYAAYGEMARLGLDPYVHHALPREVPIFSDAMWQWQRGNGTLPVCVYGAGFVALARGVMMLPIPLTAQLDVLRLISCVALLVCTALLYAALPGDAAVKRRAALFFGCNPVAIWSAIEGHNDTVALAAVLAGVVLLRYRRAVGTLVVTLAAFVKLPGLAVAAAVALNGVLRRDRAAQTACAFLAGTGGVLLGSLPLISALLTGVAPHARYEPLASVQALGIPVAVLVGMGVFGRTILLRRFPRQPRDGKYGRNLAGVAALGLWLALPGPYPWYAVWLLPLGACAADRRVAFAVFTVAMAALLRYVPDAAGVPSGGLSLLLGLAALAAYAPLFTGVRLRRRTESVIIQRL
jgi:hypothetical protein